MTHARTTPANGDRESYSFRVMFTSKHTVEAVDNNVGYGRQRSGDLIILIKVTGGQRISRRSHQDCRSTEREIYIRIFGI